ncbi:peptidyl-prolyl cis-trans isomerase [Polynucleobacter sp. MWH-Creno-3A4]|uniref:peptidylprolyl isomerase n=1 Tax=Polynucleobacter sp. MWH-Creno-3A4 TaxID=1855886 RepID=UPI001C0D00F3|nr:peptidyl-prolyl cis-trans isomerase [Polynucleobacter sp. MWH-Creno-3A4]MBU3605325.1 peptidyl-prolyl cis-trans isomerase [Polynucleobacter sp. MWH-Creno-3A4]
MKILCFCPLRYILSAMLLVGCVGTYAQSKNPSDIKVNGVVISQELIDLAVKSATPQGQQPTPALENEVKQRLINIELLAQDAVKQGIDKTPENQIRIRELRQNLLAELLLVDYLSKNPITEDQIRAEYERQLKSLGTGNLEQYKLGVIALPSQSEAASVIAQIKSGEPFAKIAKQKSIDPSRDQGGQTGWVLPAQINPSIALVMTNLPKGGMSSTPIQTPNGWYILKVEEKRPFKVPAFEETKNQIRANLAQQKQAELIEALREKAKITQ